MAKAWPNCRSNQSIPCFACSVSSNGPTASHFSVHQQRPVIFPRASPTRARAQTPGKRNQLGGATSVPAHLANREKGDVISGSRQVTFQLGPFSILFGT